MMIPALLLIATLGSNERMGHGHERDTVSQEPASHREGSEVREGRDVVEVPGETDSEDRADDDPCKRGSPCAKTDAAPTNRPRAKSQRR